MAGAYCRFCGDRCFVLRVLPDGLELHMATCSAGMAHDRSVTGHDQSTARNPRETVTAGGISTFAGLASIRPGVTA